LFSFVGCQKPGNDNKRAVVNRFHKGIPKPDIESLPNFPIDNKNVELRKSKFRNAKLLTDLFTVERMVRLEATSASLISNVDDAIFLNGFFFVLDSSQRKILKFSEDGKFVDFLGRSGNGPGEFVHPFTIERVYGGNIGVLDMRMGRILVYSSEGTHIYSTPRGADGGWIIPSGPFVWESEDLLYVSSFQSTSREVPLHTAGDPTSNRFKPIFGFGTRSIVESKSNYRRYYNSFAKVGHNIWTGSPYTSTIEVFSKNGNLRAVLNTNVEGGLTEEELDGLDLSNKAELSDFFLSAFTNNGIYNCGEFVLVQQAYLFFIYDKDGNRLTPGMLPGFEKVLDYYDQYILTARNPEPNADYYSGFPQELELMKAVGFQPENADNENPYLRIGRVPTD
jgi:hypothetical protein